MSNLPLQDVDVHIPGEPEGSARVNKGRLPLMIGTDLVQAVLLLAIPLLWWLDALSLGALLVIVFLYGMAAMVNMAATMSFLPRLVPRDRLQPAHARVDGADAVGSMAGPAIGGALVSAMGAPRALPKRTMSMKPVARPSHGPDSSDSPATATRSSTIAASRRQGGASGWPTTLGATIRVSAVTERPGAGSDFTTPRKRYDVARM